MTALCGSLLASAALSQLSYILEIDLYRGVKLMQLIPIGLFALAYLLVFAYEETGARDAVLAHVGPRGEKGRIKRCNAYFAELMKTPMQRGWFLAVVGIAVAAVFLLAVFFVSMYTDGYWWGVAGSVISVLAVNFAFRAPYFAFNFTLPENLFSGMAMLVVSIMTSTLTTRIKKQEQLRMESETEKMRANLLRAVSHDLRTPLTSIYGACSTVIDNYDSQGRKQKITLQSEACAAAK